MNNYFNPEAEVCVLSILINQPDSYYELTTLKEYMFSSSPNQFLYSVIAEMVEQNIAPEYSLVKSYLESNGKLTKVGGLEYLNYIVSQRFENSNLREYERLIIDSFKARRIAELVKELSTGMENSTPVEELINKVKQNVDNLTATVAGNQTTSIREIATETFADIMERAQHPGISGWSTGYKSLDTVTGGIMPGDLWILAARPSMGKTAMMCNIALNSSKAGNRIAIFSLEMTKKILLERLLAIESGVDISDIRFGQLNKDKIKKLSAAVDRVKELPIFIDSNYSSSIDYIVGTTRKLKKHHEITLVMIDYIQLLAERDENSVHALGKISRSAKLLANDLGLGFIILSQLNRGVELRENKRPELSDLRQSGNLEEDADVVTFLYRDEYYNPSASNAGAMEYIIKKQRNGVIGTLPFVFNASTNIVTEK